MFLYAKFRSHFFARGGIASMIMAITFMDVADSSITDGVLEDFRREREKFKFVISQKERNDFLRVAQDFGFKFELDKNCLRITNLFDDTYESLPKWVYKDLSSIGIYVRKAFGSTVAFERDVCEERWKRLSAKKKVAVVA